MLFIIDATDIVEHLQGIMLDCVVMLRLTWVIHKLGGDVNKRAPGTYTLLP